MIQRTRTRIQSLCDSDGEERRLEESGEGGVVDDFLLVEGDSTGSRFVFRAANLRLR
jgi:hypothetical protein